MIPLSKILVRLSALCIVAAIVAAHYVPLRSVAWLTGVAGWTFGCAIVLRRLGEQRETRERLSLIAKWYGPEGGE